MPTLQDLLATQQPDKLQEILASIKGGQAPAPEQSPDTDKLQALLAAAKASPAPGPTPDDGDDDSKDVPPSPVAPQMLGMPDRTPASSPLTPKDTSDNSDDTTDNGKKDDDSDTPDDSSDDSTVDDGEDALTPDDPHGVLQHYNPKFAGMASPEQQANLKKIMGDLDSSAGRSPGFSNNTVANLKDAQDQAQRLKTVGMIGQGLNTLNSGIQGAIYRAPVTDNSKDFFKQYNTNADDAVKDFKDASEQEKNDPQSNASMLSSKFAGSLLTKAGFDPKLVDGMSYNEIEKKFPVIAKMMESNDTLNLRKQLALQHSQDLAQKQELINLAKTKQAGAKEDQSQDKALMSTQQLLESARGNPAAAQAEKDLYAASKADSLANLYGDPNKLSQAQVHLLASEIGKIANGGVATEGELKAITPQSLTGKMSQYVTNLTNNPTPANAAAFVKQYQDYTTALKQDAQKVIQDKYGRVIESRKKQLGDQNYQSLQNQYINRFGVNDDKDTDTGSGQDSKISDYATQHGLDYDTAKGILVNRGYKPQE